MNDVRPTESARTYRSGAIEIDAIQRYVLIDGAPAKLGARAFDVLLALVERRERVVPKHELMELVWPRLVVEENNLLVHMVTLRKLLGPRAIVTIPGRGYQFALPVDAVNGGGLTDSAPSSEAIRGNLPPSPPLFGREQDLDAVHALLREHAVVSIVGAAGIGKTRLALAAAVSTNCEFPNGRWWVELAPITEGAQVYNSITGTLGTKLPASRPPHEALAMALASRNLLLVLDNCEHVADEVAALIDAARARAPNVRLLVTSQELLKCRDEHAYRLGPLAVPANTQLEEAAEFGAVALFMERAHAVDSRFRLADDNVSVVVDMCRRLDGIPLAIELAAARVPLLGVHGLHARLNQMFDVLTGGARMKLRRHQTLRAALDWSYGLLSADEQAVFRRLGVFAGGFSLELAQQVVSDEHIDQWLVLDLLGRLIDKSLVIANSEAVPRYHLLETTRAFALEQLASASESAEMLRRHAQALSDSLAFPLVRLPPSRMEQAVREVNNLRAALDWATASDGSRPLAYELLSKSGGVWRLSGLMQEGSERMQKLWPLPSSLPARIEADFCLGWATLRIYTPPEELWDAVRRAETLYRQLGDLDMLCFALLNVALIGAMRDHISEAEQALREAEQLVAELEDRGYPRPLGMAQGELHLRRGQPELAIAAFRRNVEELRQAGNALGENVQLGNVGWAQLAAGELDAAIESLRNSVDGLRRMRAPYALEFHLGALAIALAWRGDDLDILPLAREAFDFLRVQGVTFAPVMAAALQHARCGDSKRAVLLTGYAYYRLPRETPTRSIPLPMQQRVRDRVPAEHSAATVETWLREGEGLTEEQAAAIAFDDAPV
jgi:predicted ATPase/DNA-binding winged helix-turn-helix (wHTH) protein